MSWVDLLIDSCVVQRFTAGVADAYGVPAKTWTPQTDDTPCRIVPDKGTEVVVGAQVVIAEYILFVGDIDITEQDRVISDAITYEVLLVKRRKDMAAGHHKECLLRVVR